MYHIVSKNIECHEIKIISKISSTMLNFAHKRYRFYANISIVRVIPTLPVTEYSAHIPCVFRIHKGVLKKKAAV